MSHWIPAKERQEGRKTCQDRDNLFPSSNLSDRAHFSSEALYDRIKGGAAPFASSASMIVGDDHGVRRPRPREAVAHERGQSRRRRRHQRVHSHTRLAVV